jgi:cell division protein FtsI (penicillin-binding protein 3)
MRLSRLARLLRAKRSRIDPLSSASLPDDGFELAWRRGLKQRVLVVVAVIGVWGAAIELRLVQLQIFRHGEFTAKAREQQELVLHPEALRGDIVDRHGNLLAYSVEADSIGAEPGRIEDPAATAAAVCAALGDCSSKERRELASKLGGGGKFTYVRRSRAVSPQQVERVAALKLRGIFLPPPDTRRYYPRFDLAAHVLGYVGLENNGQAGVEYAYDRLIRGIDGLAFARVDARRQRLESRVERAPVPGATLELTIDLHLQHIAERELKAGVEANRAKGGTALILDPSTGEILALANYPTFNPNAVGKSQPDDRRNRAVQDVYEPGSTFKVVTASAALEEGVVTPTDLIDTNPGYIKFPGRKPIRDDHFYGVLTFEDVIVKSSNVGAIRAGLRTGIERLSRYVHRFGFGEALAPDFVGQSRGIWNPNGLDESGLASVSMGYQVSVTPLQMATAVSAVANGGLLMEPRVVRALVRGGRREVFEPKVLRRAISPQTAATLTAIMEGVVSNRGTARRASLDGYQAAGKTGTAKKVVGERYSDTDYNASFVGFVPSRRPVFTILVVIDSPRSQGYYGGVVAAPIFKRIAEAALVQAGVPPTINPASPVVVAAGPTAPPSVPTRVHPMVGTLTPVGGASLIPDVSGLSAREALRVLTGVGLSVRFVGTGFVVRQSPSAGDPVDAGGVSLVHLDRTLVDPRDDRGRR